MTLDDLDDRLTVTFEGCGWTHWQIMLRMQLKSKRVPQANVLVIVLTDLDSNQGAAD